MVTAPPYYPAWQIGPGYQSWRYQRENIKGVGVFRAPLYVPKHPNMVKRMLHLISFAVSSILPLFRQRSWKPEFIITLAPTLVCAPGALLFSRLAACKSVLHIQDFELDIMMGLGMARLGTLGRWAEKLECSLLQRFDRCSTISQSMMDKLINKFDGAEQVLLLPNWVDIDFVKPLVDCSRLRQRWGIEESTKVVLYSGTLGKKQGLEVILEAAKRLYKLQNVLFLIVGMGVAKDQLIANAESLKLTNIKFYPLQEYEIFPELMALADIHLVVQRKGVADAVLPSKVTAILAAGGNSLITAEKNTELGVLCENFPGIARRVPPEDQERFITVLQQMLAAIDTDKRFSNRVARDYAEKYLQKDRILRRFMEDLKLITGK